MSQAFRGTTFVRHLLLLTCVCGLWRLTGPFPWARDLETSALKVISGHWPVHPGEACINNSAPWRAQQPRDRKSLVLFKTETRSSGRKGPISFGLGWGGGGAGGVGGWDLEVQGARKSKSGRLLSGSVPSGVGSGTSAKSEGEMCRFPSGLRIPLLFWLL